MPKKYNVTIHTKFATTHVVVEAECEDAAADLVIRELEQLELIVEEIKEGTNGNTILQ